MRVGQSLANHRNEIRFGKVIVRMKQTRLRRDHWRYFSNLQTRWHDNDVYRHVNNTVYYSWFDTVVNGWLVGQGLLGTQRGAAVFLVAQTSCVYFEPIAFPESVDIGLAVDRLGTSSVTYDLGVFREHAEFAAAQARFVHVAVDIASKRPVEIPTQARAQLQSLLRELQAPPKVL